MILLITPPFVQPNAPYPATAYLTGYLRRAGIACHQTDLSIELLESILSADFMRELFAEPPSATAISEAQLIDEFEWANIQRIYALHQQYESTVESVRSFLRGLDPTLAHRICSPGFLPQGARFEGAEEAMEAFGRGGIQDCAKYLATLYLHDVGDYIRAAVTPHFEWGRYGEKIALSVPRFEILEAELQRKPNLIEQRMLKLLHAELESKNPDYVGFTIPFPGNLLASLRCAQYIRQNFPSIRVIAGGGYPTTELRSLTDKKIFDYFDYIVLDDGELALERIIKGGKLINTYTSDGYTASDERISHLERGCPDFSGLLHSKYFSTSEIANPMLRLWGDGRWNKMTLAHGCYWAKCSFCDTSLDYIRCYDPIPAATFVDWMEQVAAETGSCGFHLTDEAAPPKLLKKISLEILRRGLNFTWWTNIRFESAYTGDVCALMAAAGCIAVSGGLETANDRLLALIDKGIGIEEATIAMRNFFYAGIMTHAYLMYGFPTQTLQESVDSLEVVRQMFRAELIDSAHWHRYAMTAHSPSGADPGKFGVRRRPTHPNPFANNEVHYAEDRGYHINMVGNALHTALACYMAGEGLDRQVHKWFESKVPATTVEPPLVTDHLIKPDNSRIFNDNARLVWIAPALPERTSDGILVNTASERKTLKFADADADFLVDIIGRVADLDQKINLKEVKELYKTYSDEPFATLYHSKKWDILRGLGLLQI